MSEGEIQYEHYLPIIPYISSQWFGLEADNTAMDLELCLSALDYQIRIETAFKETICESADLMLRFEDRSALYLSICCGSPQAVISSAFRLLYERLVIIQDFAIRGARFANHDARRDRKFSRRLICRFVSVNVESKVGSCRSNWLRKKVDYD